MQLFDNESKTALEELGARLAGTLNRYDALHLPGEAGVVTFITEAPASREMQAAIVRRALEVAKLAGQVAKVSNDQNLSDEGKRNLRRTLDADRIKIAAKLESDSTQIEGVSVLAKMGEEQLYAAPAIERGDFETAMTDREIRSWFSSQSIEQLGAALKQMTHRQLEALQRSPIPLGEPLGQLIEAAWEQHLETNRAKELQIVQADLDNARFGVASIEALKQAVGRLAYSDRDAVIRPAPEEARAA